MSSELSMAINADQIRTMPDPAKLIAQFTPSGKPFVLGVVGPVKSAYPDGPRRGDQQGRAPKEAKERSI